MNEQQRYWITFDSSLAGEPVLCEMARRFAATFTVRNASVTKDVGIIALEFSGERQSIKDAVAWMESRGIQVEPVEINTIEG